MKLFSVLGIPVEINATWLIAVALITFLLSTQAYPSFSEHWSTSQYWIAGAITTLLLFTSVLAHELGHSIVALVQGLKVNGITLLLFGGVSRIQGEASRPRNEFFIAFAGPAVSLIIGFVLIGWWFMFHPVYESQVTLLHGVVFFTGSMNILVAIFNLLPGYPMDGGRVLRSAVWGITGDTKRASRVAYSVGRVVFFLLIGYGALQVFNGDMFGGIWIILIGWFLMSSARSEARGEQERKAAVSTGIGDGLGFSVALATKAIPQIIEADTSVNQALSQGRHTGAMTPIPIGRQGELIGFVVRRELDDVPLTQRNDVSVRQLMNSGSLRVISRGDSVREALRMMDKHQVNQLVVMDDDYVIGIVTREDIVAILVETRSAGEPHNSGDVGTPV